MAKITIDSKEINTLDNETVLDALLRSGVNIPHGCRQGGCFSCVIFSLDTVPPAAAQEDIGDDLIEQKAFFACQCKLEQDMNISLTAIKTGIVNE